MDITDFLITKDAKKPKKFDPKSLDGIIEQEKQEKKEKIIKSSEHDKRNTKIRKNNDNLSNLINNCDTKNELTELIRKRIMQHIRNDKQHSRIFNDEDYITINDVLQLLKKQNNKCKFCHEEVNLKPEHSMNSRDLDAFSIDRINNKKAHIRSNCAISCFYCNANRKDYRNDFLRLKKSKAEFKQYKNFGPVFDDFDSNNDFFEVNNNNNCDSDD